MKMKVNRENNEVKIVRLNWLKF